MKVQALWSLRTAFGVGMAVFAVGLAACAPPTVPTTTTTTTLSPAGVHTDYTFNCEALGLVQVDVDAGITVDAPATVDPGETFNVDIVVDQITIPAAASGATISSVGGWNFKFPVPANSIFLGATLSGGQGYTGTATIEEIAGVIDFKINGTATALATVDYPKISVSLLATGPAGSDIDTTIGGTSYADAGLTFNSNTNFGAVSTRCFPYAPVPVFSSTHIEGAPLQTGICYEIVDLAESFQYTGPVNTLSNSLAYNDATDCSTTPVDNSLTSILSGMADEAEAQATCNALQPGLFTARVDILGPMSPQFDSSAYWACFPL